MEMAVVLVLLMSTCGFTAYVESIWTTSDSPSCRYNCGYDLGTCSCSSSCQYYGRCCHDYHNYCYESGSGEGSTPGAQSCMYNCGYDLGTCSCSSSCQYYGQCCHDFYDYCSYYMTTPGYLCGTTMTEPQGEFFSPGYPYNYPNNARCSWTLQGSEGQVVSLRFTFVDFEICCDRIRVYDGPSDQYQLLGTVVDLSINTFSSSTRYMTVLFTSDGSVTAKGFRAKWNFLSAQSCMYKCGYDLGTCSCSSSCQYYGRCCHDYHNYCYESGSGEGSTPDVQSCRYNCGYDLGTCSCSSSCQYYGRCCHDYYNYCHESSGEDPVCGGSLHVSGEFSSPYYPNDYQNDAQCEWTLSAPAGQTILLSFIDIDLEHCCHCDYLHVFDGLSSASPLIATVCQESSQLTMHSSSSHMTIQFRSDEFIVGRGFKAFFSSSLNHNTGQVDCSSDLLNITVRKSYVESLGYEWHQLTLDEPWCQAYIEFMDSDFILFTYPLSECGTVRKVDNGRVIYTNNVRIPSYDPSEITRQRQNLLLKVSCTMDQTTTVGTLYNVLEIGNSSIGGTGKFDTIIEFYPSSNFSHPITQFPYQVDLDQDVYVQVQLSRPDSNLQLFLDTCVASPSQNFSSRIYYLIRNGCETDNTLHVYTNGRESFARFMFRTFMFLRAHNSVFLKCEVAICPDSDLNSRCRQGCRLRKKRSLGSTHRTEVVTLGPITLRANSEKEVKMKKEE